VTTWELTVTLNYPAAPPTVELLDAETGSLLFAASMAEDVLAEDSTSDTPWRNLTFNGYAPSGDVSAEAVCVDAWTCGTPRPPSAHHAPLLSL
jgi:hypothetical protein